MIAASSSEPRPGLAALGLLVATTALALATPERSSGAEPKSYWAYVGTYTGGQSKGIYRLSFDPETGKLGTPELAAETPNPTFLAVHPSGKFLYAVNEIDDFRGKKAGAVTAYAVDPKSGALTKLNEESTVGDGPCHVVVDAAGKNVLVANYGGGSVAVLPIQADGSVKPASAFVKHAGSSVDPNRQTAPFAHSINLDAANAHAAAADLGIDKVLVYDFDADKGTLTPTESASASVKPGAGPRHFAFHPDGRHAYVIGELDSTVTAFDYDPKTGKLSTIAAVPTLPPGSSGRNYPADLQVHPSGKFLYGSNRGADTIAIFAIDSKTGIPTPAGHQPTGGKNPRNFAIDPSGKYFLTENQDSDSILVHEIDPQSGALTPTGVKATVPKPVCLKFVPRAE